MAELTEKEIIEAVTKMGFIEDNNQWAEEGKGWIRFVLGPNLDERDLRLIWYKEDSLGANLKRAANILFKAGQKQKIQAISELISLT